MAVTPLPASLTNPAPGTVGWLLWLGRVMLNSAWVWRVEEPALCWEQETPTPPLEYFCSYPFQRSWLQTPLSGLHKSLSGWCTNNLASSHGTASTERVFAWAPRQPGAAAWRLSFMEHLIARHLQGQELKLAEELPFQWFLPPLNYFSFKNKFLNISPQFYAKPQSSI